MHADEPSCSQNLGLLANVLFNCAQVLQTNESFSQVKKVFGMGVIGGMGDIVEKVQFFDITQSFPKGVHG
jgi:hypothetical protein